MLRKITKRQFDSYCYARKPLAVLMSEEIAWFEAYNLKLLGFVFKDLTDQDFGFIILGRDKRKLFRCIEVSKEFRPTPKEAFQDLERAIVKFGKDGKEYYPQGDEKDAPTEVFDVIVPENKVHPYFQILTKEPRYEGARNLIKEIMYSFVDVDGNYIQQFQTDGFDARLWELYLYMYLYNSGFELNKDNNVPDFCLNRLGYEFFIEAVTVGPNPDFDVPHPKTPKEIYDLAKDYLPIKFGSSLFSKINRERQYWELSHVKGKPFILAIHDYHVPANKSNSGSMTWSRTGLVNYLYGLQTQVEFDGDKNVVYPTKAKFKKIEEHSYGEKTIPSNFFEQEDSEYVSAIIFSNSATLATFNRMGKLAGLGSKKVKMIRMGFKANPDPEALIPISFTIDIDDPSYEEAWSDGLIMYHNPHALYPVDERAFPDISHLWFNPKTQEFSGFFSPNEIFTSVTISIMTSKDFQPPSEGIKALTKEGSKKKI